MNKKSGCVFNIARFSINDGPGIRTTIFLKGCSLHCDWCHNPESISPFPQLTYRSDKCIVCGKCVNTCNYSCHSIEKGYHHINIKNCTACGMCYGACPVQALEICGKYMTAREAIDEVKKDMPFYISSNGGVTISGGEPLFQADFTKALLKLAKTENIHTCIETSGMCDPKALTEIAENTDLFLFDYKHSDSVQLEKHTGAINNKIYENLKLLERLNKAIVLRCPIIPGINDIHSHFDEIINLTKTISTIIEVNILPYHSFGVQKSKIILSESLQNVFSLPQDDEVSDWVNYLKQHINHILVKCDH